MESDIELALVEDRAKAGLFLSFQSPIAIPGVSSIQLLRQAYAQIHGTEQTIEKSSHNPALKRATNVGSMSMADFLKMVKLHAKTLHLSETLLSRGIHDGMSGGERKKLEMLQALVLQPKFAIFDEIDTGLDVDALRIVATAIASLKKSGTGIILVTHYQRILQYIPVDVVHVLVNGTVVASGDKSLASDIEKNGSSKYQVKPAKKG
jgi:Fe-S cluster assembly ATP-binding protein